MDKPLSEMTNQELWRLFPIILTEHDPRWKEAYRKEQALLKSVLPAQSIERISHIGSTAVPGLLAKPTVDILLEIRDSCGLPALVEAMEAGGYIYSPQPDNPPPHMMFMKGYTPRGFEGQAFHVHVRYPGDWDEPYFRDYLTGHPEIAEEYGRLKMGLMKAYEHDRDGYTRAKTDFIKRITALARRYDKK